MMVPRFKVRLKEPLVLFGLSVNGVKHVSVPVGEVMIAYKSPGYLSPHRSSWLIPIQDICVAEVFQEDIELMTVEHVDSSQIPPLVKQYTTPDHRGFTTLPYQKE